MSWVQFIIEVFFYWSHLNSVVGTQWGISEFILLRNFAMSTCEMYFFLFVSVSVTITVSIDTLLPIHFFLFALLTRKNIYKFYGNYICPNKKYLCVIHFYVVHINFLLVRTRQNFCIDMYLRFNRNNVY